MPTRDRMQQVWIAGVVCLVALVALFGLSRPQPGRYVYLCGTVTLDNLSDQMANRCILDTATGHRYHSTTSGDMRD